MRRRHALTTLTTLALVALALTAAGCDEVGEPGDVRDTSPVCPAESVLLEEGGDACSAPWRCEGSWTAADGFGCAPPPLRDDCPEGTFALADGACSTPWSCPEGWRRDDDGPGCRPPTPADCPDSWPLPSGGCAEGWACAEGWRPAADGAGCEPIYDPCPFGRPVLGGGCDDLGVNDCAWPPVGLGGDALFVSPKATAGDADGSLGRPFASLDDALGAASPGAIIALDAGAHAFSPEARPLKAITLVGRCARQTRVTTPIEVTGARVTLRGLTLEARGAEVGLRLTDADATLDRVQIVHASGDGLVAEGGAVTATRLRVADVGGDGARVTRGGSLSCDGCLFERARRSLVRATGDGARDDRGVTPVDEVTLRLTDTTLRDARAVGHRAPGLRTDSADVELVNVQLHDLAQAGALLRNSDAWIQGLTITHVRPNLKGFQGVGLYVDRHCQAPLVCDNAGLKRLDVQDLYIAHSRFAGLLLWTPNGTPDLQWSARRVALRGTTPSQPSALAPAFSTGLFTQGEVVMSMEDVAVVGNVGHGVTARPDLSLEITRGVVRGTRQRFEGGRLVRDSGVGVKVEASRATLRGLLIEDNAGVGVGVTHTPANTRLAVEDTLIRDHQPRCATCPSGGLVAIPYDARGCDEPVEGDAAALELRDVRLERNATYGLFLNGLLDVTAERLAVTEVTLRPDTTDLPAAVIALNNAHLTLRDAWLADNTTLGVVVRPCQIDGAGDDQARLTPGTRPTALVAEQVTVARTRASTNHPNPEVRPSTAGLVTFPFTRAELARVALVENTNVGVSVFGELRGEDVWVQGSRPLPQEDPEVTPSDSGLGIAVSGFGALELTRAALHGNHGAGVAINSVEPTALRNLLVRDTRSSYASGPGAAITCLGDTGLVSLEEVRLLDTDGVGLLAVDGASIEATRLQVERTRLGPQAHGHGIVLDRGASFNGRGVRLLESDGAGALVASSMTLTDGVIQRNAIGLLRNFEGAVTLTNVLLRDNVEGASQCGTIDCSVNTDRFEGLDLSP